MPSRSRDRWRAIRLRLAPPYSADIEAALGQPDTVLDVGCGVRSPIAAFTRPIPYTVGVDGHEAALRLSEAAGIHDEYRNLDVRRLADHFAPGSFDAVLAIDLLEHLTPAEGLALISVMEEIARERVVLFTPNGFVPQGEVGGNPLQVHQAGWSAGQLRSLGYQIVGVHGPKLLRGEEASIRWRPRRAWSLLSDLTAPFARRFPVVAYHLLATKRVGEASGTAPRRSGT